MARDPSIIDVFFSRLTDVLMDEIESRMAHLAAGSAKPVAGSNETVAENYARDCAVIDTYNTVLLKGREIYQDIYGRKNPNEQGNE